MIGVMLTEMATVLAQTFVDEDGKLHAEIEELRKSVGILTEMRDNLASDLEFHKRVRAAQGEMIGKLLADRRFTKLRIASLEIAEDDYLERIELLSRPLWVKIVAWFARHGS